MVWTATNAAASAFPVFVSILPQKYFVSQIGGSRVDISVMVAPGANPENYEPKPRQMAALSKARLYFAIGVPFEKTWLTKIAAGNPEMRIVRTQEGITPRAMATDFHRGAHNHLQKEGHAQTRGLQQESEHGIYDPHIWLAPSLVMIQARHIFDALAACDSAHRSEYEKNYHKFVAELAELDSELKRILAGRGAACEFMVFHPAWGYFADAYGLRQVPIEIEGKDPKPAQLKEMIEHAKRKGIKVIFAQPQFSVRSAQAIARAIEGRVIPADPLAPNWPENLRQLAAGFKAALR
ncbi:MAG: zinc ABC transporter substrate-binding protein [Desulfobacterales bacterium]|nr:MAG: zinc ABC transporter substrate-binding protein [Desulfobacterales bacterium]